MPHRIELTEQYRRSLSTGLGFVEEMLEDIVAAVRSEGDDETAGTPSALMTTEIERIRLAFQEIRATLSLPQTSGDPAGVVFSRCAKMWEVLSDMRTKRLQRYGQTPAGLSDYLDPRIDEVLSSIERILDAAKTGR